MGFFRAPFFWESDGFLEPHLLIFEPLPFPASSTHQEKFILKEEDFLLFLLIVSGYCCAIFQGFFFFVFLCWGGVVRVSFCGKREAFGTPFMIFEPLSFVGFGLFFFFWKFIGFISL